MNVYVPHCMVQDIDSLQEVWEIAQEWNSYWDIWKVGHFAMLQTKNMESTAQEMFKKLHQLKRELKVSSAPVDLAIFIASWSRAVTALLPYLH